MAEGGRGLNAWLVPKKQHNKLTNAIYASKAHKIICCRAKDLLEQKGREIINKGLSPICEKGVPYEMLITFKLDGQTTIIEKCIKGLQNKLQIDKYLTSDHAKIIKDWINEGEKIDEALILLKAQAKDKAYSSLGDLQEWFTGLEGDNKKLIKPFLDQFKQLAKPIEEGRENFFTDQVKQTEETPDKSTVEKELEKPPSISFDLAKAKLEGSCSLEEKSKFWEANEKDIMLLSGK